MSIAKRINKISKITGQFKLRSGVISDTYFDKYRFEADPKLLKDIASEMLPLIPEGTEVLAGLEMGGIPIVTMLSQLSGLPSAFIRKEPKEYGTCQYAEGTSLKDKKIVLIEDVVSSGGAIIDAVKRLRDDEITLSKAICVIDRETGGKEKLAEIDIELIGLITRTDLDNSEKS